MIGSPFAPDISPPGGGGGGSGTVTSVGLSLPGTLFSISGSPVTVSGTLTGSLVNQTANTVFAGPTSGGAAVPTFRALVSADIPSVPAALSSITAATAANTIANLDNAQVWQWSLTTANKIAHRITESAASTATGTPVLWQIDTIAASTAVPLLVQSRGTEVFRVSATTAQVLATSGSAASPTYSFQSNTNTGIISPNSTTLGLVQNGIQRVNIAPNGAWFYPTGNFVGSLYAGVTIVQDDGATGIALGMTYPAANANPVLIDMRKSRGTQGTEAAITSGDEIGRIRFMAHVGSTNAWVEAARIYVKSTGTITDSSTGVGGNIVFQARAQGSAMSDVFTIGPTVLTVADAVNVAVGTTTGTKIATATTQKLGFFNATPVVQQTQGATLTNNVTAGGTANQLDNFTSLSVYSTDAATIRNDIYQLGQTLKTVVDSLRTYGLLS